MKTIRTWLERAHDKVMPLHHFQVDVRSPEYGGYPTELWGGREVLQRRDRKNIEKALGACLLIIASGYVLDAVAPDISLWNGILLLAPLVLGLLTVAIRAGIELNKDDHKTIRELAQREAFRAPRELRIEWESCPALRPLLWEALNDACNELTEAEAEVALVLSTEHTGTIRELCEIARELCRSEGAQSVQHTTAGAHS